MRIAIDLGGTHVRVAAAASAGGFRRLYKEPRPARFAPDDLVALLRALMADEGEAPRAIGVSVAAVVDREGRLSGSENLGWGGVPLRSILGTAFACPVAVETDVFCGALFEAREGAARGAGSALYLGIGTGVGHALILGGSVWRGAFGGANAFGHLVLDPAGQPCYCGNRGCLCQTASGLAQAGRPASDEPLLALARGIGSLVTLVEPERVILAGGALNQDWFDADRLTAFLPRFAYPAARLPQIVRTRADEPNLRGALHLAMELS